jgi:GNAT superfamily N-acetyltransferase
MASLIRIRAARPQDKAELEALKLRASLAWGDHVEALKALPEARQIPDAHLASIFVAELASENAGFATILMRDDGNAELEDLFVEPCLWRGGIGSRLIAEAGERAIALGARSLHVVAGGRARGFYEACGFHVVGNAMTLFEPAFQLRKELAPLTPAAG